jgi:hypothetical protein
MLQGVVVRIGLNVPLGFARMSFNTHDTFNKLAKNDTNDPSQRSSKRRGLTLP